MSAEIRPGTVCVHRFEEIKTIDNGSIILECVICHAKAYTNAQTYIEDDQIEDYP